MKMKYVALIFLGLVAAQAYAEQAMVIDTQMLGEPPAPSKIEAATTAPAAADTLDAQAEANRQRLLKGGKRSLRERTAVAKAEISTANVQEGEDFLAAHKTKPGVVSLPSGVQYKILKKGKGKRPTDTGVVTCRYRGTLINGSDFDKTDPQKTATLNVSGFLPGVKEAVELMPAGSKWEIVVPPQLAYGSLGNRGVGPNAVLIYEMEIVSVK